MICEQPTTQNPGGRTGTHAGYLAHLKEGEDTCDACRDVEAKRAVQYRREYPEKVAVVAKRSREKHSEKIRARTRLWLKARHRERRAWLDEVKARPCADCGVQYPPYVMQFDHRDPAAKEFTVGRYLNLASMEALIEEIAKCDIVCGNCHAERTFGTNKGET